MILKNVRKIYPSKVALENVSLQIGEGEITAVLGESGAGKTTLLNVLAGLTSYEGEVERGTAECAMIFQEPKLLPHLTAEGNLKFVLPKSEWHKIPSMLGRVGLGGREKSYPHEFSGGERQRIAVARAFLYPHAALLMDEPFSSLDLAIKKSLIALVTELWQETRNTVVFVTHDVREAVLLASRAVVLREGKIAGDYPLPAPYPRDFFADFPEEQTLVRALMQEP